MNIKAKFVTALSAMIFAASASASPITLGSGQSSNFSQVNSGVGGYNFRAEGSITVTSLTSTTLDLAIHLVNASTLSGGGVIPDPNNVRLSVWGFAITPNVTGVTFSDPGDSTGMIGAALGDIPSIHAIEVCAFGHNCSSGANLGVLAANFDDFTLTLTAPSGTFGSTVDFDLLGVKWQTNVGSFEYSCSDCGGVQSSGFSTSGQVPEPSSSALALLGVALLGGTFVRRRMSQRH